MSKFTLAALAAAAVLMTATAAQAGSHAFDSKLTDTVAAVHKDPNYKSIPLVGSPDNVWFYHQCEDLWAGRITKDQFVANGVAKFPGYDASFSEVADNLTAK